MEIINKFDRTDQPRATTPKQLSRLPNNGHSLQIELSRMKINERTVRRHRSKIQLAFIEDITHRKLSNESFQIGTRSQNYELEPSDLLQRDNHSSKRKIVQTVRHQIFVVVSQVKTLVVSFVLNKI